IAIERDRADAAHHALILEQAELLLHSDPTAAAAALDGYRGHDRLRQQRLLAEAEGRGVARGVLAPHSSPIWFAVGDETGAIVTLGEDRRLVRSRGDAPATLAGDASSFVAVAYEPATRQLAYATAPVGIAVIDLRSGAARRFGAILPATMWFSRDGARLAALSEAGDLEV